MLGTYIFISAIFLTIAMPIHSGLKERRALRDKERQAYFQSLRESLQQEGLSLEEEIARVDAERQRLAQGDQTRKANRWLWGTVIAIAVFVAVMVVGVMLGGNALLLFLFCFLVFITAVGVYVALCSLDDYEKNGRRRRRR